MHLSKMQSYAIHLLRELRQGAGSVSTRDLAKRMHLSVNMVQQITIPLLAAKLITSDHWGYRLANRRRRATVADIVRAAPQRGGGKDKLCDRVKTVVMGTLTRLRVDDL